MKRSHWCVVTVAVVSLLGASLLVAQTPPRNLHKVDDHWTAWDPPAEFPAGAEVYIIVPGDTLWDLAQKNFGDPYLWPQLWEQNQYILDAHWIYPGDPLVVSVEVTPIGELGDVDLGEEAPGGQEGLRLGSPALAPQPLGTEDDIYCSGYIGDLDETFGYRIVGSEFQVLSPTLRGTGNVAEGRGVYGDLETVKVELTFGDVVYLDGGRAGGLSPGLQYTAVEPREVVRNPHTDELVGRLYAYLGRLRVLSVQEEGAIAEIVQACDAIHVGDGLRPFVPEPVPLGRRAGMIPANDPAPAAALEGAPTILSAKDRAISLGTDHVVFIDQGQADGVAPGDLFTIYRINRPGFPPVVLGELAVLSVHQRSSVAKIIDSRYTVYVGDYLTPK